MPTSNASVLHMPALQQITNNTKSLSLTELIKTHLRGSNDHESLGSNEKDKKKEKKEKKEKKTKN